MYRNGCISNKAGGGCFDRINEQSPGLDATGVLFVYFIF